MCHLQTNTYLSSNLSVLYLRTDCHDWFEVMKCRYSKYYKDTLSQTNTQHRLKACICLLQKRKDQFHKRYTFISHIS